MSPTRKTVFANHKFFVVICAILIITEQYTQVVYSLVVDASYQSIVYHSFCFRQQPMSSLYLTTPRATGIAMTNPRQLARSQPFLAPLRNLSSLRRINSVTHLKSFVDDNNNIDEYSFLDRVREGIRTECTDGGWEKEWEESVRIISELSNDMSKEQIESCLAIAWNWKRWAIITSPMARKFIQTIPPDSCTIASSIRWLQQPPLQLTHDIIQQGIVECPDVFLINPQQNYEKAIHVAPTKYQDPVVFRTLLSRQPSVLRCTYNCVDSGCNSECGNCWVSFQYQLSEQKSKTQQAY
jgi:hypothetical protein